MAERVRRKKTLMEAAIQKSTNDEIKTLHLKLELLQEELRKAVQRAEYAENELKKIQSLTQSHTHTQTEVQSAASFSSSDPSNLNTSLSSNQNTDASNLTSINNNPNAQASVAAVAAVAAVATSPARPPPPPPPLPAYLLYQANVSSPTGVKFTNSPNKKTSPQAFNGSKIIENVKHQVQPGVASGLDALVRELKSGRVTLRRNRRVNHTNEALKEMFQVLEISQTQNRNSQICIDMHI